MPTKAETDPLSNLEAIRMSLQESHSWTDDLPVCQLSGIGFSTNQIYRVDGTRKEEHEFEDRSFRFRLSDEDTFFYGVFDGHVGCKATDFASQRMPAEILLDQLRGKESDKEIKEVLHQAFIEVEGSFFESIYDLLAEKEKLRLQLQGLRTYEALQNYPDVVEKLNALTIEIESGTTAVVALIHKNKIYVANVGDSRALLCRTDKHGNIRIHQLSVDHDFKNEDELLRLSQLGVDVNKIHHGTKLGHDCTRCIGNYTVKGGYKEFNKLSDANDEPVIAEPYVSGGIEVDESCKFLLLMSDGLYKSLEQATGSDDVNVMIVGMVIEQFAEQSTLTGVAQAVVDKVARIHHDSFMRATEASKNCQKREDITLLVRNFNQPLPNAHGSPTNPRAYHSYVGPEAPLPQSGLIITSGPDRRSNSSTLIEDSLSDEVVSNVSVSQADVDKSIETDSVTNSSDSCPQQPLFQSTHSYSLNDNGRIKPYVDFGDFYKAVEEAYQKGHVPKEWCKPADSDI